jgi:acylphosphatase
MLVARRFVVRGRVQGVGFRWFVQELAALENAAGWVQNRPDGTVEALVQGEAEAVERIERQIRRGPPAARVEHVDVADEPPLDSLRAFSIRG